MVLSLLQEESNVPIPKATRKPRLQPLPEIRLFLRCGVIQIATPSDLAFDDRENNKTRKVRWEILVGQRALVRGRGR